MDDSIGKKIEEMLSSKRDSDGILIIKANDEYLADYVKCPPVRCKVGSWQPSLQQALDDASNGMMRRDEVTCLQEMLKSLEERLKRFSPSTRLHALLSSHAESIRSRLKELGILVKVKTRRATDVELKDMDYKYTTYSVDTVCAYCHEPWSKHTYGYVRACPNIFGYFSVPDDL